MYLWMIMVFVLKEVVTKILQKKMNNTHTYGYLLSHDCPYNVVIEDDLPYADDPSFKVPDDCIFFVETSCTGDLNFRQACAVESAAKAHPNRQVNVFFAAPVPKNRLQKRPLNALLTYPNVKLFRIVFQKYGKKTPLRTLLRYDLMFSTKFIHHAADVLRFLTLYKFGGIFLDLDVMVIKSFDTLPLSKKNFIAREDDETFSVGILAFSKDEFGRALANTSVKILKNEFNPYEWIGNGIDVARKSIMEVYNKYNLKVESKDGNILLKSTDPALDFTVYKNYSFYPVSYTEVKRYFSPGNFNITDVYLVHFWNALSKYLYVTENSIYAKLARQFCPKTMRMYHFKNTSPKKAQQLYESKMKSGKMLRLRTAFAMENTRTNLEKLITEQNSKR